MYQKFYCWGSIREFVVKEESIVYCTKCETNHADDATICIHCGAPLYGTSGESRPYWRRERYEKIHAYRRRGKPFIGIFIGLTIILVGFSLLVSELYGIHILGCRLYLFPSEFSF